MGASRSRWPLFRWLAVAALVLACIAPSATAAQGPPLSLAEIAKKELERRKTVKVPSKVFTDKDVRALRAKTRAAELPAPAVETTTAGTITAEATVEAKDEAWWRARVALARENILRRAMLAAAVKGRIDALVMAFANSSEPFQRLTLDQDREKAVVELARAQADVELSRTHLEDIEEEGRKAGIPPGWIR